jgi:hypothetical protein
MAIFRFTSLITERSNSKHLYNSMEHVSNYLGAKDDALAAAALECLASVVCPYK